MALVAHRMMLPARHRRTQQQVARNKVGVLLVPSLADYYNKDGDQLQQQPQQQLQLQLQQQVTPATSQLELQAAEGKVSATSCSKLKISHALHAKTIRFCRLFLPFGQHFTTWLK
ncbi:uncharacterized protein LOC133850761 [Drosophila sulfurigaster albostrigata]|uniref:uncharacterized protein LOC133850761 n=1 Tax=Drosophila sulfurigaster albostrigata TaxID=89887 RepID=UPI002D21833B|nr:uncharacterized protein LOC133850761 [Drosophila sulfurigaster albostrigata]